MNDIEDKDKTGATHRKGINSISDSAELRAQLGQFFAALLTFIKDSGHAHIAFSYANIGGPKVLNESWTIDERSNTLYFSEARRSNRVIDFDAFTDRVTRNMRKYLFAGILYRVVKRKPETHSQYAELRAFFLSAENGKLAYHQSSAKEVDYACNTDSATGEPLEPEDNVVYCGIGDDRIYNLKED